MSLITQFCTGLNTISSCAVSLHSAGTLAPALHDWDQELYFSMSSGCRCAVDILGLSSPNLPCLAGTLSWTSHFPRFMGRLAGPVRDLDSSTHWEPYSPCPVTPLGSCSVLPPLGNSSANSLLMYPW